MPGKAIGTRTQTEEANQGSVLVVDDEEKIRELLSLHLGRKGHKVAVAGNGKEALELLEKCNIDLVLMDIRMPGMTGIEVLKILRGTHSPTELPVIMVTGVNQSQDIVAALDLGANDYVTKPIDFPVVSARIQTQLLRKKMEKALRESEERYALAARGANDGLWDWNLQTGQIYFSTRWKSMLGFDESEIGNSPEEWFNRVHPEDIDRVKAEIQSHVQGLTPHYESEHRMLQKDGTFRWMLCRGLSVRDAEKRAVRMAGSQADITESKVTDALTGLPNRLLFMDRLRRLIERTKRRKSALFAVLSLDLDRFMVVNDSLGHLIGDQLLIAIARKLEGCLRSSDTVARLGGVYTVARTGGDEFTILLDDIRQVSDATRVADRIQKELLLPFNLEGHEVFTTLSIGIAISTTGYEQPEELLRDADTAMYRAKALGKARYEVFNATMRDDAVARLQLETDLRLAIEREEFRLYFQPIVSLNTNEISGFEALVRWQHPNRGLVSPTEFIPVAEETGMIIPIGLWVLREACCQTYLWQKQFRRTSPLTVSVNLSCKHFMQTDVVQQIDQILQETGLDAQSLKLEITESLIMENPETAVAILMQLRVKDIQVGIDDFGTGYSSLSYLHRFPINTLKIDRSFVNGMGVDKKTSELVQTVMTLAHNLGVDVIAEGVETMEQLTQLKSLECEYGQGYYFSNPLDRSAAEGLLMAEPSWGGNKNEESEKTGRERRSSDRIVDDSIIIVSGYGLSELPFSETTKTNDVSTGGVSFWLRHPIEAGAVLDLTIFSGKHEEANSCPTFSAKARVLRVAGPKAEGEPSLIAAQFQGEIVKLKDAYDHDSIARELQQATEYDESMRDLDCSLDRFFESGSPIQF